MCGIAAIIGGTDLYNYNHILHKMTDIIDHRGPDCDGHVSLLDDLILLGHRRLSILDLSKLGAQPMSYRENYWITYNGEIYNYKELKTELMRYGYEFKSNTDTEVILAAYDYWGRDCLNRFNGMWAFILVDLTARKVFISRDRFGVKPLYYWKNADGAIAIASEIKQFSVFPDWNAVVNGQRVYDYLRWGQIDHMSETMFRNVMQIRAGEAAELDIDTLDKMSELPVYTWYRLSEKINEIDDERDAIDTFYELFLDSIKLRLRSDVKVGSCLSGGVDSSSIVCVVNELLKQNGSSDRQCVVSAYSKIKKYDESLYAKAVLNERDITSYFTYPEFNELFDVLENMVWHQDEPFGSTSIFAQWRVFDISKQNGLKVMLDGQGADEQLAGYHSFFAPYFTSLLKSCSFMKLCREIISSHTVHGYSVLFAIKGILSELMPETVCNLYRTYGSKNDIAPSWINMEKINALPINPVIQSGAKTDSIKEMSISQMTYSNLQKLLHWEDRDSMAHSIESRLPFLDYRLVEFVLGLPDSNKIKNGVTKSILRESMKGILPELIRGRMDKMGFVTPEEYWVRSNPDVFLAELKNAVRNSKGILTEQCIVRFNEIISDKRPFDGTIWRMICLGKWVDRFGVVC